jgi:hypothetical protein
MAEKRTVRWTDGLVRLATLGALTVGLFLICYKQS